VAKNGQNNRKLGGGMLVGIKAASGHAGEQSGMGNNFIFSIFKIILLNYLFIACQLTCLARDFGLVSRLLPLFHSVGWVENWVGGILIRAERQVK
jgi:hypothetical protein